MRINWMRSWLELADADLPYHLEGCPNHQPETPTMVANAPLGCTAAGTHSFWLWYIVILPVLVLSACYLKSEGNG